MKTRTLVLALASIGLVGGAAEAGAVTIPVASVPTTGATAAAFAPGGWVVEKKVRGDLDRDGDKDLAIVLAQDPAANPSYGVYDGSRALLVVRRESPTVLRRAGLAPQLLGCKQCGGAFWGAAGMPVTLSIVGGNVVVTQQFGARELTQTTHRIRWNTTLRKFRLVGLDTAVLDRLTGNGTDVSTNYLSGRQVRITRKANKVVSRTVRNVSLAPKPIAGLVFGRTRP